MFKHFRFSPHWLATLLTFSLIPLFISLGFWQLDRARQNEAIMNEYRQKSQAPPQPLEALTLPQSTWRFTHVAANGQFDNQYTYLLDNAVVAHRVGYKVLTLFVLQNGQGIMVDRGFIPVGKSRQQLPIIKPKYGRMTIQGLLIKPFKPGIALGGQNHTNLKRLNSIDISELKRTSGYQLYPYVLLLDAKQPSGYQYHLELPTNKSNMNKGYALQWFSFAASLFIIYIFVNLRKTKQ